jgi:hypothetical protein
MSADAVAREAIAALSEGLDGLAGLDVHDVAVDTLYLLVRELETASRRLAGVRARVVVAVEADGRWASDGSRSITAWLRRATDASPGRAHRLTRTARALREHLPLSAQALSDGRISAEHADLLAQHTTTSPARLTALSHPEVGEAFLVDQAEQHDASTFHRLLRRWAIAADPQAGDRDYRDQHDKEHLVLAKTLDGYHLQGWLSDTGGAALDAALQARTGTPHADDQRTTAQRRAAALVALARHALDAGTLTPGAAIRPHLSVHVPYHTLLQLTAAQAPHHLAALNTHQGGANAAGGGGAGSHQAAPGASTGPASAREPAGSLSWRGPLPEACTPRPRTGTNNGAGHDMHAHGVDGKGTGQPPSSTAEANGTGAPHLVIPGGLDHHTLTGAAPAELDDGTPLPHALLARLACDSQLARVIFGPQSEILDAGRTKRLFTPAQRRAIIARDRHCQYPGCTAPPTEGEIHHSIWWYAHHGHTRTQDGILLCWHHHDHVHAHTITIERTHHHEPGTSGHYRWHFRDRHGRPITRPARPIGAAA